MDPLLFNIEPKEQKISRRRPADLPVNRVNKKVAKGRYYLHKQLGPEFIINGHSRKIDAPYRSFEDIPVGPRYYVGELIKIGYQVQYKIFSEDTLKGLERSEDPGRDTSDN